MRHAGYDSVAANEIAFVQRCLADIFCQQTSLTGHGGRGGAVALGIDGVQTMGKDAYSVHALLQCLLMGMDIHAIGQTADDKCVGAGKGEFLDEITYEVLAVLRAFPCTDYADDLLAVQLGIAKIIEHKRSVWTLTKQRRIVRVVEADALDVFALGIGIFLLCSLECLINVGQGRKKQVGRIGNEVSYVGPMLEDCRRTAHILIENMGIHQTHLTELAQCDGVYRFLFGHAVS